jgi:hypothetical protein
MNAPRCMAAIPKQPEESAFRLRENIEKAEVTAVYILEVPHSIPINGLIEEKEKLGELALKRAEAISREFHLSIHLELLRTRSIEAALSKLMDGPDLRPFDCGRRMERVPSKRWICLPSRQVIEKFALLRSFLQILLFTSFPFFRWLSIVLSF